MGNNKSYDAIIIGAGLGGLVCGAELTRKGKKVLLLEKHFIPGGYASHFKRKKYNFEVGLHAMNEIADKTAPDYELYEKLNVYKNVKFLKTPQFYNFHHGDFSFRVSSNFDTFKKDLIERFPEEAKSIKKYFRIIKAIRLQTRYIPSGIKLLFYFPMMFIKHFLVVKYLKGNTGSFLDKLFKSEELKMTVSANYGYYHDDLYKYATVHFCAAQASYLIHGGYFVEKGSQSLSDYLAKYIMDNGSEIEYQKRVTNIIIEKGKVKGLKYKEVNKKDKFTNENEITVNSDVVVGNAAISVIADMLPDNYKNRINNKVKNLKQGLSLLNVYLALNRPLKEIGNSNYSTFVYHKDCKNLRECTTFNESGDYNYKQLVLVDYSQLDTKMNKDGRYTASICILDYYKNWEILSDEEYNKKKRDVSEILINRIEAVMPGFKESIEFSEVATPLTMKRYTGNPEGCVYGYYMSPERMISNSTNVKSNVKGLYYASVWTIGGGASSAMKSGFVVAQKIARKYFNSKERVKMA